VLTNGFVVDVEGKKLSKSGTGYQKPIDLMTLVNEHGADVLRLWVASQDYQDDIPFSNDIFARVADSYRSIRNTLRILLGNLADFDPAKDAVPQDQWTDVDKFFYQRYVSLGNCIQEAYSTYQFSQVYHMINRFCAVDLSAQYVDLLKDRLYCNAKTDLSRRASQTVMTYILLGLTKYLAPLIPFTAEELWQSLVKTSSVHKQKFPLEDRTGVNASKETPVAASAEDQWAPLFRLRDSVNEKLEEARRDKKIGKSLEACVEITGNHPELAETWVLPSMLEELFIVSKVVIKPTEGEETITVTRAEDHGMKKCVRCWKYWGHVGSHAEHPILCDRCTKGVVDVKF
jgi:isoleucyl-tRNA synthetase